jgi:prepilin signal peptidase PulO-like enzyme (type II secretory pathway)
VTAAPALAGAAAGAAAGWLGTLVASSRYGALRRAAEGPRAAALPVWLVVAVAAAVGVRVGLAGAGAIAVAVALVAVLALSACAATDARAGIIPDPFTLGPLAVVLAVAGLRHAWDPLLGAAFAVVPFGLLALVSRGRGMGWGDVKLAALGGALVGATGMALAVAVASPAALAVNALVGRAREPIAFGPYLAAAIGLAFACGSAA